MKTLIIAEPGCTAEGRLETMLRQVEMVAAAGADAFKSQWTSSASRMVERRRAPEYERFYRWLEWPGEWHQQLAEACRARGLQYGCSVYLPEDVERVEPFVEVLKVSSFEASDVAMLEAVRAWPKVLIISAGLGVNPWDLQKMRLGREGALVLRCTSAYPAPLDSLALAAIRNEQDWDGIHAYDGWSDHSDPAFTWLGALAVAAGAEVLETHVRLDSCDPANPDFIVARSPRQFEDYVRHVRFAETALGAGNIIGVAPAEEPMLRYRVTP